MKVVGVPVGNFDGELDTCKFFVNHILTRKRYQNLNSLKFHVLSQFLIHRKEAKLPKIK